MIPTLLLRLCWAGWLDTCSCLSAHRSPCHPHWVWRELETWHPLSQPREELSTSRLAFLSYIIYRLFVDRFERSLQVCHLDLNQEKRYQNSELYRCHSFTNNVTFSLFDHIIYRLFVDRIGRSSRFYQLEFDKEDIYGSKRGKKLSLCVHVDLVLLLILQRLAFTCRIKIVILV